MSMTFDQLIKLYILQKNYHTDKDNPANKRNFLGAYSDFMFEMGVFPTNDFAPKLFPNQPRIPFVLFMPTGVIKENPRPLIIHTHGGPNVYMDEKTPHVEIAYFLSQGFIVACPNYRGSTGYPSAPGNEHEEFFKWIEKSKGKHHIYGPEDVY